MVTRKKIIKQKSLDFTQIECYPNLEGEFCTSPKVSESELK